MPSQARPSRPSSVPEDGAGKAVLVTPSIAAGKDALTCQGSVTRAKPWLARMCSPGRYQHSTALVIGGAENLQKRTRSRLSQVPCAALSSAWRTKTHASLTAAWLVDRVMLTQECRMLFVTCRVSTSFASVVS